MNGHIGDFQDASRGFSELDRLTSSGDQAAAIKVYHAEWDTDRAELLTRHDDPQQALAVLQRCSPVLLSGNYQVGRVAFFHQLAITQNALHHDDEALADALASVKEAEVSLAGMHSTLAREQWAQANAPVYEELVKIHLQHGDTGAALQAWERLRRAPYAAPDGPWPAHPAAQTAHQSVDVLVIARIDDAYIGWLADSRTLQPSRTVNLGDAAVQHRSALTFYRLCADRASSLADVHRVGGNLYNTLLKPFAAQQGTQQGGAHTGHLFLDLDPSLAMLPVSALTTPDGGWLGDGQQITVLPPWWSLHPESVAAQDNITPAMKMVLVSGFSHVGSEVTELARLFPYSTVLTAADSRPGKVAQALASADLFHFAGHSSAEAEGTSVRDARVHGEADPPRSDGVTLATALTPEAVAAVRLPRSRLAVLAACNTTAADPDRTERLPDLRNALLLSGTHAVVASSWDVDDQSTRQLMLRFYGHLLTGAAAPQGLQKAQHDVRSAAAWKHPYFWAAFQTFTN